MTFDLEATVNHRIATVALLQKRLIFKIIAGNNLDITPEQWTILYYLWQKGGWTIGELAESSRKDFANTTRIVHKLVAMGYAEKRKNSSDNRVYNVYPTPEGESLKNRIEQCWQESRNISLRGISQEEQDTLVHLLSKVEANVLSGLSNKIQD